MQYRPEDRDYLIRTIYGEAGDARDEAEMRAVAEVIRNRAKLSGASIRDEVLKKGQFEPWMRADRRKAMLGLKPDSRDYLRIANIVDPVLGGQGDITGGATHFYSPGAQKELGRDAPAWDDGTGRMFGRQKFFNLPYAGKQGAIGPTLNPVGADQFPALDPVAAPAAPISDERSRWDSLMETLNPVSPAQAQPSFLAPPDASVAPTPAPEEIEEQTAVPELVAAAAPPAPPQQAAAAPAPAAPSTAQDMQARVQQQLLQSLSSGELPAPAADVPPNTTDVAKQMDQGVPPLTEHPAVGPLPEVGFRPDETGISGQAAPYTAGTPVEPNAVEPSELGPSDNPADAYFDAADLRGDQDQSKWWQPGGAPGFGGAMMAIGGGLMESGGMRGMGNAGRAAAASSAQQQALELERATASLEAMPTQIAYEHIANMKDDTTGEPLFTGREALAFATNPNLMKLDPRFTAAEGDLGHKLVYTKDKKGNIKAYQTSKSGKTQEFQVPPGEVLQPPNQQYLNIGNSFVNADPWGGVGGISPVAGQTPGQSGTILQQGSVPAGYQQVAPGRIKPMPGGEQEAKLAEKERERSQSAESKASVSGFTLRDARMVDEILPKVSNNAIVRKVQALNPMSEEYRLEEFIGSMRNTIAIEQLLNIKRQGAGLGQVPQTQINMLSTLMGSLNIGLPKKDIKMLIDDIQYRYGEILAQMTPEDIAKVGIAGRELEYYRQRKQQDATKVPKGIPPQHAELWDDYDESQREYLRNKYGGAQ